MDDYEKLKYVALGLWGLSLCLPGYQTTGEPRPLCQHTLLAGSHPA